MDSINNVLLDPQTPTLYRVDKDEFSNGLALVRSNLVQLMSTHPIASSLRDLIVHGSPPRFREKGAMAPMPPSQLGEMNEDQQAAVDKVLQAEDFAMILGMPGTGKTTTIAHIIRALLAEKTDADVAVLGEKCKAQLGRSNGKNIVLSFAGIGKDVPTFADAQAIADQISMLQTDYGTIYILYNKLGLLGL